MSGAFESAPMPTAGLSRASASGRPPLQAWVPRKRNLASFDALDELSHLTGHKQLPSGGQGSHPTALPQSGPNQQLQSGPPLRAPKCLPGAQEPALQRVYIPCRPTVHPADLPKGPEGATVPHACYAQEQGWRTCSRAPGSGLAASSQLARHPGTTGHRLHHKPFASPRPIQKPGAEDGASVRPSASSLASAGCGSDEHALQGVSAAASPHHTHHRFGKGRATNPVPRGSESAWVSDGVISDSEASEASDTGPDRQQPGNGPAGVASVNRASILNPFKVASHIVPGSRELQPLAMPGSQDATGEQHAHRHQAQPVSPAEGPSRCGGKTASPPGAAAARLAQQLGKRGQSAGRKRLKRLYSGSDDAHMPPCTAGPTKGMEGEDVDVLADMGDLSRQSPSRVALEDKDSESSSEGADSLGALSSPEHSPAPQLQGSGRGLKRLRRITAMVPESAVWGSRHPESKGNHHDESAHTKAAVQGAPKANPFRSAKATVPQEPRLACHAAPAQPQCNTLNDAPVWGDMHSLLRGPGGQQQARANRSMNMDAEATAGGIIDLASDDSAGAGEDCAGPPARPRHRRICLPGMPTSPGRRSSQGRQPSKRSYLGAYSSADIMPEPAQPGKAQTLLQESAAARSDTSPDRGWLRSGDIMDHNRHEGAHQTVPQASPSFHPGSLQQDPLLGDQQNRQPKVPGAQQYRAQSGTGVGSSVEGAHPDVYPEEAGASRPPRHGAPWWHRLEDFVPVAAIREGRDPRDGSRVLIDYSAQFSGEKHPTPAGGGFQQAKRGRKTQQLPSAAQPAEATRAEGSCVGHWLTTHQHGRRRKVYVTAGGRKQLTGSAAHTAYERDKRAAGSFAKDI